MNRYLIDSHVLIWLLFDPEQLGPNCIAQLQEPTAQVAVSAVSLWELSLKHSKRKLPYEPQLIDEGVDGLGAKLLPLTQAHIRSFSEGAGIDHADPFDAMLCAVAHAEQLQFVTADHNILSQFAASTNARK
jgi:PIN domain nuclease of toxin-antitoxin system